MSKIELTKDEEEFVNEVSKYICKNVDTLMCANGTCPNQWHCPVNYPVLKSLVKKGYLKNDTLKDQRIAELEEQLKNAIVINFKVGDYFLEYWNKDINIYQYMGNKHFRCLNKSQGYHCDYVILGVLLLGEDFIQPITKEQAEQRLKELKGE